MLDSFLGRFSHEAEELAPATPGWMESPERQPVLPSSDMLQTFPLDQVLQLLGTDVDFQPKEDGVGLGGNENWVTFV